MKHRRVGLKALSATAIAGVLMALMPSSAQADIYWAQGINAAGSGKSQIGEGTFGGGVAKLNIGLGTGLYVDVAVGSDHIYWADYTNKRIGRSDLTGGNVQSAFIVGLPGLLLSVAVDRSHIYWTDKTGKIGRANLDGTGVKPTFINSGVEKQGVAVDGQHIYWAEPDFNRIGRANLDGSGGVATFITGASKPTGVTVDGQYIYWTNSTTKSIGRSTLAGTSVSESFISSIPGIPLDVGVDSSHVYWSNTTTSIGRANLTGLGPRTDALISGTVYNGIAIVPPPTVTNLGTRSGPVTGGTSVKINGSQFNRTSTVLFGTNSVVFSVVSDTQIIAKVPAHSQGAVAVSVVTAGGTATKSGAFTYNKLTQSPTKGCVTAPKKLPRKGLRQLAKPHCSTQAGQTVRVKVTSSPKNRKHKRYYKVTKAKNGAKVIRTYGKRTKVTVTWYAPASGDYLAYSSKRKYRV